MNNIYKYLLIITCSIGGFLLVFNLITPVISSYMPNQYAKAELVMDSLNSNKFKPEIIAFGSSVVQTGLNGYILQEKLNNNKIYNLAGPNQGLNEICGYFPFLPSTVKKVIIGIKIEEFLTDINKVKSSSYKDSLFHSYLSAKLEIKKEFLLKTNFKNRASLKAGIQIFARGVLDNDAPGEEKMSIVYPYLYPNNRSISNYQKAVFNHNIISNKLVYQKVVSADYLELLNRTNEYLKSRGIDLIVYLSPKNPDITFRNKDRTKDFIAEIEQNFPAGLNFINYFYSLEADDFYDAEHPNRIGGDKIAKLLAKHI